RLARRLHKREDHNHQLHSNDAAVHNVVLPRNRVHRNRVHKPVVDLPHLLDQQAHVDALRPDRERQDLRQVQVRQPVQPKVVRQVVQEDHRQHTLAQRLVLEVPLLVDRRQHRPDHVEQQHHRRRRDEHRPSPEHVHHERDDHRDAEVVDLQPPVEHQLLAGARDPDRVQHLVQVVRHQPVTRQLHHRADHEHQHHPLPVGRRLEQVLVRVLLRNLLALDRRLDLRHLEVHQRAAHLLVAVRVVLQQDRPRLVDAALRDQPSRRLRNKPDRRQLDRRERHLADRRDAPAPLVLHVSRAKRHPRRHNRPQVPARVVERGHDLAVRRVRQLGDQRRRRNDPDAVAHADDDPRKQKHRVVGRAALHNAPDHHDHVAQHDGSSSAKIVRDLRRDEKRQRHPKHHAVRQRAQHGALRVPHVLVPLVQRLQRVQQRAVEAGVCGRQRHDEHQGVQPEHERHPQVRVLPVVGQVLVYLIFAKLSFV
ncbi:hypothetical protein KL911_005395, partial [Ogataea haglerorum]|uniref:uncharacterized protein n=1 Tax=Ogataea haglerorum TaxID=1937702 RepID=UPI001C8AE863